MLTAPKPDNEHSRLASLRDLDVLDSAPEAQFNALARAAAFVAGTPISLLSLVDSGRQWFKANIGLPGVTETSRDAAFCAHTILQDDMLEIPDAWRDERFFDNPLVVGAPGIRFYAGAPVRLEDGSSVGSLCVIDRKPRKLSEEQRDLLRQLAQAAAAALEGRRAIQQLREASGEMHYNATHDALTGLVNRSEFESRLRRVLQKAGEDRSEHALLYIDIDQFKLVNDSCGHAIGDQLLQQVGKLFADAIRTRDTLARLGGDEFAIILEHCSAEQAQRVRSRFAMQWLPSDSYTTIAASASVRASGSCRWMTDGRIPRPSCRRPMPPVMPPKRAAAIASTSGLTRIRLSGSGPVRCSGQCVSSTPWIRTSLCCTPSESRSSANSRRVSGPKPCCG